jgi:hypothetical protein
MSGIFAALGLADTDRSFVNTLGQRVVYDAVAQVLAQHNADLQAAYRVFIGEETSDFKRRYKLPGGGYLQRRGGSAQSAAVKATGQWDVAFPLEDFGAALVGDDVSLAYMNMQELNRHIDTITQQDINTVRREILKALLANSDFSFEDPLNGTLTCVPLANGDEVLYPPVLGAETEDTHNHLFGSNYAASSISDTNNPFPTIVSHLEEHFGAATGGENIVTFINNVEAPKVETLADFDAVNDRFVIPGADINQLTGLPSALPGRVIGRCDGSWVVEWRSLPPGYMLGVYMEPSVPKPLIMRTDPSDTGLPTGLTLVSKDLEYPLEASHYRHRFGVGVGNRLNGVIVQLVASTNYSVPSGYSR